MDDLPELKDIHLPENGVSVFPLAYGWWCVPAMILLFVAMWQIIKWFRKNSKKIFARRLLQKNGAENTAEAAVFMSELLRRICVSRYPEAVTYAGKNWVDFLNEHSKDKLSAETARLLIDAPYAPTDSVLFADENVAKLRKFCLAWIGHNL